MNTILQHDFNLTEGKRNITITAIDSKIVRSSLSKNGNFRLTDGEQSLGDMQFDEEMVYWVYNGPSEFTRDELVTIADFIKHQQKKAA
jgi:hypothetical protein